MGKQQQQQQQQHTNKRRGSSSSGSNNKKKDGSASGGGDANKMRTILTNNNKRQRRLQEIAMLEQRIQSETPPRGSTANVSSNASSNAANSVISFRSLPISEATLRGLENPIAKRPNHVGGTSYTTMTEIQAASLPHSLAGRDILGAARTGSGKTLAYCIPVLEILYRNGIVGQDSDGSGGPSAIILSPTRELAVQILQVFKQVGHFHIGIQITCLIGGTSGSSKSKQDAFLKEQQYIAYTNIIIATPGRLLQHLQETCQLINISQPGQVKILILDEADRILDNGFKTQLIQILEYLPNNPNNHHHHHNHNNNTDDNDINNNTMRRQTLLFSATQTRHVKDLATLSLYRPEYIRVHDYNNKSNNSSNRKVKDNGDGDNNETVQEEEEVDQDVIMTPERLQQSYIVVPLKDKLNAIYSFIKSHLHCKSIIFMASCSQVRHAHLLFCALRPGITILCLHGKLLQSKRTEIYQLFQRNTRQRAGNGGNGSSSNGSNGVVLFSTDVCARGLDFPNVDWVVQADAPEDRDMYIHRAGRTARYKSHGKALLMITPQEERNGFIRNVLQQQSLSSSNSYTYKNNNKKQLPIKKLAINPTKTMLVTQRAAALVASNIKLHQLAKKAFSSYLKSVMLMPHQQVFKLQDYQVPNKNNNYTTDIQQQHGQGNSSDNNTTTTTTDLDDFALSLGLASTPRLDFITKFNMTTSSSMNRDECRSAKNVNRKLQKLKEQIKAEKLAKKKQKLGNQQDDFDDIKTDGKKNNKTASNDNDKDGVSDDEELLISKSKQRHDKMDVSNSDDDDDDSTDLPDPGLDQVTRSRKAKRIRIDARGSGQNKRIVFEDNDEGTLQAAKESSLQDYVSCHDDNNNDAETLHRATEEYMQKVRDRLQSNEQLDREQERDRIRQKHRKRRLQDRASGEWDDDNDDDDNDDKNNNASVPVTLLSSIDYAAATAGHKIVKKNKSNNDDESSRTSDDESSTTSSSSSSSSSCDDEDENDDKVKAQEELALALIRGRK